MYNTLIISLTKDAYLFFNNNGNDYGLFLGILVVNMIIK